MTFSYYEMVCSPSWTAHVAVGAEASGTVVVGSEGSSGGGSAAGVSD